MIFFFSRTEVLHSKQYFLLGTFFIIVLPHILHSLSLVWKVRFSGG